MYLLFYYTLSYDYWVMTMRLLYPVLQVTRQPDIIKWPEKDNKKIYENSRYDTIYKLILDVNSLCKVKLISGRLMISPCEGRRLDQTQNHEKCENRRI